MIPENIELRFKINNAFEYATKQFIENETDDGDFNYNHGNSDNLYELMEDEDTNNLNDILYIFDNDDHVNSFIHSMFYDYLSSELGLSIDVTGNTMPSSYEGSFYENVVITLTSSLKISDDDFINISETYDGKGISVNALYDFLNKIDYVEKKLNY